MADSDDEASGGEMANDEVAGAANDIFGRLADLRSHR